MHNFRTLNEVVLELLHSVLQDCEYPTQNIQQQQAWLWQTLALALNLRYTPPSSIQMYPCSFLSQIKVALPLGDVCKKNSGNTCLSSHLIVTFKTIILNKKLGIYMDSPFYTHAHTHHTHTNLNQLDIFISITIQESVLIVVL